MAVGAFSAGVTESPRPRRKNAPASSQNAIAGLSAALPSGLFCGGLAAFDESALKAGRERGKADQTTLYTGVG